MGTTHFRSDIVAKSGSITANSVTATTITGSSSVVSSGHFKIGSHQYILAGAANTEATIVAAVTAVDASCKGSMYMSSAGALWYFDADDAATRVTLY